MVYLNAPQRRAARRVVSRVISKGRKYGGAVGTAVASWAAQKYGLKAKIAGKKPVLSQRERSLGGNVARGTSSGYVKVTRNAKYTVDPTNKVSTSSSGGMTTHSMTVNMGSKKNIIQKLVKSSKESFIHRFGAIQPFNNTSLASINWSMPGGGAYTLANYNSIGPAGLGSFDHYMPLHIVDLTCTNNINTGTLVTASPMSQLLFKGSAVSAGIYSPNRVDFATMNGRGSDGITNSMSWNVEKSTRLASSSVPLGMIMQEWVQIKMLCYGAKIFSTRYKVQVVQITEDDFHPLEVSSIDAVATPAVPQAWDDVSAPINFWQGLSAASYKHPIATVSTDYRKHLKVIKEFNFIIDPTTTIEERAEVGHSKALNIFVPMYRANNYNSKSQALDGSISDQDNFGTEFEKNEAYLKPRARIYLIVQATNPKTHGPHANDIQTVADTPSYDIMIRSKFSQLS